MYKNILQGIDNIAIWPVVSFVIFFLFFVFLVWHVFTTDKSFINKMKELPFDNERSAKSSTTIKSTGV